MIKPGSCKIGFNSVPVKEKKFILIIGFEVNIIKKEKNKLICNWKNKILLNFSGFILLENKDKKKEYRLKTHNHKNIDPSWLLQRPDSLYKMGIFSCEFSIILIIEKSDIK